MKYRTTIILVVGILTFANNVSAWMNTRLVFKGISFPSSKINKHFLDEGKDTLTFYPSKDMRIVIRLKLGTQQVGLSPIELRASIQESSKRHGTAIIESPTKKIYYTWLERSGKAELIRYWEITFDGHHLVLGATIAKGLENDAVVLETIESIPKFIDQMRVHP